MVEQLPPTLFPHLRSIGTFKEGTLLGEDEIGSVRVGNEFHRSVRRRDALVAERHRIGNHDAAVGNDVAVHRIVGAGDALGLKAGAFAAADATTLLTGCAPPLGMN